VRRVLIESPYSSGTVRPIPEVIERNVRYLRACLRDCILRGETPYASHGLLTQPGVLRDDVPEERATGIEAGFVMRRVMDATAIYTDLGWSSGMLAGQADAESLVESVEEATRLAAREGLIHPRGHVVEERQLGGEWATCRCKHSIVGGDRHAYECPMWRAEAARYGPRWRTRVGLK